MKRYFRIETYDNREIYFSADVESDEKLTDSEKYKLAIEAPELSVDDIDNVDTVEEISLEEYDENVSE